MKGNWRNTLLLFIPGTLWGITFFLIEIILEAAPPFTLTAIRNLISSFFLLTLLYVLGGRLPTSWKKWKPYLVVGFFNQAFPFAVITWGQQYIDSGLASILVATMPLFTILLAHFFTDDEQLNANKVVGISLGLLGIIVLVGPGALETVGQNVWGQLAALAGSISYAIGAIFLRRFFQDGRLQIRQQKTAVIELLAGQLITTTCILVPLSFLLEGSWYIQPTVKSVMAMLLIAFPITIIPALVYYSLIDTVGAGFASLAVYLIPINGVLWGALLLNESITWPSILSLCLILSGIAMVNRTTNQSRPMATEGVPLEPAGSSPEK